MVEAIEKMKKASKVFALASALTLVAACSDSDNSGSSDQSINGTWKSFGLDADDFYTQVSDDNMDAYINIEQLACYFRVSFEKRLLAGDEYLIFSDLYVIDTVEHPDYEIFAEILNITEADLPVSYENILEITVNVDGNLSTIEKGVYYEGARYAEVTLEEETLFAPDRTDLSTLTLCDGIEAKHISDDFGISATKLF